MNEALTIIGPEILIYIGCAVIIFVELLKYEDLYV